MARWPDQTRDVREALSDPWAVIRALGLDKGAQRQAGGTLICCPAHGDRTPSCSVTRGPDGTVRVRCFGCDLAGDVFSLVAAVHKLDVRRDFPAVLREAASLAGVSIALPMRGAGLEPVRSHPLAPQSSTRAPKERGLEPLRVAALVPETSALEWAASVSPATIPVKHPPFDALARLVLEAGPADDDRPVMEYLRRRLLLVGARDDTWGALPATNEGRRRLVKTIVGTVGKEAWEGSGLARGEDFSFPDHRLLLPWRDPDGRIVTLQRRSLDNRRDKYVFAAGRSPLWPYGVEALKDPTKADLPVLLVEGAADVLAVRELADPGFAVLSRSYLALGVPGVATWRESWTELLRERSVCIGFDRDKAGEDRAPKLAEHLSRAGLRFASPWRVKPSEASTVKDWSALLEERLNRAGT